MQVVQAEKNTIPTDEKEDLSVKILVYLFLKN